MYSEQIQEYSQFMTEEDQDIVMGERETVDNDKVNRILRGKKDKDNNWWFLVLYNDGISEWADEYDCWSCQKKVSIYCAANGINTAYLLCRVSDQKQATIDSRSLDNQQSELISMTGLHTAYKRVVTRKIISKSFRTFPVDLRKIGEVALPGDAIIVMMIDRLGRNVEKYKPWLNKMNDKNVDIISKIEGISYKNNKLAFLRGIEVAEKESQHNSTRQTISIKNRRSRGEHVGPVKYGYELDDAKKLVYKLKEQQMIKGILLSHETDIKLARNLNDSSYPKKRGKEWTACMISRIRKMYSYYDLQN